MARFEEAGTAETLRSSQKDEQYMSYMKSLLTDVIQKGFGVSHWLKYSRVYDAFSDLAYFTLTTFSGFQTLGEEYVHVIQVDQSLKKLPSAKRRAVSILLYSLGPVAAIAVKKYLEKRLDADSTKPLVSAKTHQINLIKLLQLTVWIALTVHRLNLIIFYFTGRYYHFSKRFTGIRYVLIRRWLAQRNSQTPYKILGYAAAAQLCASIYLDIKRFLNMQWWQSPENESSSIESDGTNSDVVIKNPCSLCVEQLKHATVTPCGHLFCWSCITTWLQNKEECPLCREKFGPSRLVYLQNYI